MFFVLCVFCRLRREIRQREERELERNHCKTMGIKTEKETSELLRETIKMELRTANEIWIIKRLFFLCV